MPVSPAFRAAERAIDELKRGGPVRLESGAGAVIFKAAEHTQAEDLPVKLVLSPQRTAYLGLSGAAVSIPAGNAALLEALLFAGGHEKNIAAAAPSAPEVLALQLVKRAGLLPAAAVLQAEAEEASTLSMEAAEALLTQKPELTLDNIVSLPLDAAEHTRAAVFMERGGLTHLALLIGQPEKADTPLARVHSSCLTGDLLGSLRCDCGSQLDAALHAIAAEGNGVLLYLNQEGRGIGLANKLRAYRLQEDGLDTVDANLALGFAEDERDFAVAAQMLKALGIASVRLLTNNPGKMNALAAEGVHVAERVPLVVAPGEHNRKYLETKATKLGHQY